MLYEHFTDGLKRLEGVALEDQVMEQTVLAHFIPSCGTDDEKSVLNSILFARKSQRQADAANGVEVMQSTTENVLNWEMPGTKHLFMVSEHCRETWRIFRVEARCYGSTFARRHHC